MTNPLLKKDAYKIGHIWQYPDGITNVYSNGTSRKSRMKGITHVLQVGFQMMMLRFIVKDFNENFFAKNVDYVVKRYKRIVDHVTGGNVNCDHLRALHKLGYLPLRIKAVPEGTLLPIGIPGFTITNTHDDFFWLPNMLEVAISNKTWKTATVATIAREFRKMFQEGYIATVGDLPPDGGDVMYQGHDFSMRGLSGDEDCQMVGIGHLSVFYGSDNLMAIEAAEDYYEADLDNEIVMKSIPATEHSVMCAGGKDTEKETIRRLIQKIYPNGPISIVSDTWDYFRTLSVIAMELKAEIMIRDGKVVFRGDSGYPQYILAGWPDSMLVIDPATETFHMKDDLFLTKKGNWISDLERMGTVEILANIFGYTMTARSYKLMSAKVGTIYGDGISPEVAAETFEILMEKGFATTNVVFGIGSFTYEYLTRDTFGWAMKATNIEMMEDVDIETGFEKTITKRKVSIPIFKSPKTDDGTKKSASGLLSVQRNETGEIFLMQNCTPEQEREGLLELVFYNGEVMRTTTLAEIRQRISNTL